MSELEEMKGGGEGLGTKTRKWSWWKGWKQDMTRVVVEGGVGGEIFELFCGYAGRCDHSRPEITT